MKIKEGLILRKVGNENIVMAYDNSVISFNGVITLNDSGVFIFNNLKEDISYEDLLNKILEEYDIDKETASKDLDAYLSILRKHDLMYD